MEIVQIDIINKMIIGSAVLIGMLMGATITLITVELVKVKEIRRKD